MDNHGPWWRNIVKCDDVLWQSSVWYQCLEVWKFRCIFILFNRTHLFNTSETSRYYINFINILWLRTENKKTTIWCRSVLQINECIIIVSFMIMGSLVVMCATSLRPSDAYRRHYLEQHWFRWCILVYWLPTTYRSQWLEFHFHP